MLTPEHRDFLAAQAVDPELAERLGVRSLTSRADTADLGDAWVNWANFPAVLFPWTGPDGTTLYQVRPDNPTEDSKGKARKYVFHKDMTPVLWAVRPVEGAERIVIVEGTKQCLAAASYAPLGVAVYGIAGCRMWQKDGAPIPDLAVAEGREVVVILDSDSATNPEVYRAGEELAEALELEGATKVTFTRIKGREKDGLDDVLAARGEHRRADYLARIISGAKPKPADKPPKRVAALPKDVEILPAPTDPMAVSRVIEPEMKANGGAPTTRHWRGGWWEWQTAHWAEIEALAMSKRLYARTEHAQYLVETKDGQRLERWSPTKPKIANLSDALAGIFLMEADTKVPTWVWGEDRDCGTIVSCQNGLLRLDGRELLAHDAAFFNLVSVPFDYQADAPEPVEWLRFLETVWPEGGEGQVAALQEWFGYVISGRLDFEKIFGIIGPPRSGKGTIAAVLVELVGSLNVAGPTLASLATNFGLQPLLGKSVAIIDDARIGRSVDTSIIVERLLSISGQGVLTVDRKHKEHWEGRIPARVMLLSNELPRFSDGSGTIATRFVVTETTQSFLGKEDRGLKARLMAELPGILNWALAGLDRLLAQGRFTETEVSTDAVDVMRSGASPFAPFVDEECVKGAEHWVSVDDLWDAWEMWCAQNGRQQTGTKQWLGRDLKSVVPGVKLFKPTVDGRQIRAYRGVALRTPLFGAQDEGNSPGSIAHTPEPVPAKGVEQARIGADIPIAREAKNVSKTVEEEGSSPNKARSSNIRAYVSLPGSGAAADAGLAPPSQAAACTGCGDPDPGALFDGRCFDCDAA